MHSSDNCLQRITLQLRKKIFAQTIVSMTDQLVGLTFKLALNVPTARATTLPTSTYAAALKTFDPDLTEVQASAVSGQDRLFCNVSRARETFGRISHFVDFQLF